MIHSRLLHLFVLALVLATASSRRKCPRVCVRNFKNLVDNRLKKLKEGPRGPRGPKGHQGIQGPAGRPGAPGPKGEPSLLSKLPKCNPGEYLTSDGNKLFCVKFDLSICSHVAKCPGIPAAPQATSAPLVRQTTTAPLPVNTTQFMKKYMIQTLYTDAWDLGTFEIGDQLYLGVSQLGSKSFVIYRWWTINNKFHEYQVLKVANARKWSHFKIGKDTFFAAASNSRHHDSPVFKWVDNQFIPYQTLSTSKAFDIEPIKIKNDIYLCVAAYYGPYSKIFKWNGSRFVFFQNILAAGADMESFTTGDDVFLAVTGPGARRPHASVFKWDGTKFVVYQSVPTEERSYGLKAVKVDGSVFLAIARWRADTSLIFRWNGTAFNLFQKVPSRRARDWVCITSKHKDREKTFLAIVSSGIKPTIYAWDKYYTKKFAAVQEIPSRRTRDMEFFHMGKTVYLAVASHRSTDIYQGSDI